MYKLVNDNNKVVAYLENPRWVRKKSNGVWDQCEKDQAQAISINGKKYALYDNQIDENNGNVNPVQMDSGSIILDTENNVALATDAIIETDLNYYNLEGKINDIENAICELDSLKG